MKLGFVSAIFADDTLEEVVDFAGSNGFECIELACWPKGRAERRYAGVTHLDVDALDGDAAAAVLKRCGKSSVHISALAYYPNMLDPDAQKRRFYIEHLKKVIAAARRLDVGVVTTFLGRVPDKSVEENLREILLVWPGLLRFAEEQGVKIAIENCPMLFTDDEWPGGKNLMTTPAIWRRVFELMPSPNLGINYDPSHFVWQQIDYIKPIYEFRDRIFHVHYKDIKMYPERLRDVGVMATPLQYMSPKLPGLGDVDWGRYVSALTDIGYGGDTCIEIEDKAFEGSAERVKESLLLSKRYLRQFVI